MRMLSDANASGSTLCQVKDLLNESEVDQQYGLSRPWLRRCRLERRGPRFIKLGRMVRYRRQDIEAYLSLHAVETFERN